MALKLYTAKDSPRTKKILIVAQYTGIPLEMPPFELGKDNKTESFLRKNPAGKVPVLETAEGFLFESNAICRHLARLNPAVCLLGRTDLEASQVDQWLDFCTNDVEPSVMAWVGPILGYLPFNPEIHTQAVANVKAAFDALERHFVRNTFLVGERLTLADVVLACTLVPLYSRVWEPRMRNPYAAVNRWFETICMQDNFRGVTKLDVAHWCTVAQKAKTVPKPAAAKSTPSPKVVQPAATEKAAEAEEGEEPQREAGEETVPEQRKPEEPAPQPKEAKPKTEKPKKEAKPKKEEEEEDEAEDDDVPKEVKPKSTMDLLPKSAFVLDAFKREYSNNKKIEPTMEYLWANFDPEGYSMWFCEYKYQDENKVTFKTTNLVGGFFQRMERMHKYAFGQMLICGEEAKHDLFGFWIIRGQEIPDLMQDVPDTELYEWKKISWPVDDATKQQIQDILNWGNVRGECLDGKTFK